MSSRSKYDVLQFVFSFHVFSVLLQFLSWRDDTPIPPIRSPSSRTRRSYPSFRQPRGCNARIEPCAHSQSAPPSPQKLCLPSQPTPPDPPPPLHTHAHASQSARPDAPSASLRCDLSTIYVGDIMSVSTHPISVTSS